MVQAPATPPAPVNPQALWLQAAGTYDFEVPTGLSLTLAEILPPGAATVQQIIGGTPTPVLIGTPVTPGTPVTLTATRECTVVFSSPVAHIFTDGVTVTGNGTPASPLVAAAPAPASGASVVARLSSTRRYDALMPSSETNIFTATTDRTLDAGGQTLQIDFTTTQYIPVEGFRLYGVGGLTAADFQLDGAYINPNDSNPYPELGGTTYIDNGGSPTDLTNGAANFIYGTFGRPAMLPPGDYSLQINMNGGRPLRFFNEHFPFQNGLSSIRLLGVGFGATDVPVSLSFVFTTDEANTVGQLGIGSMRVVPTPTAPFHESAFEIVAGASGVPYFRFNHGGQEHALPIIAAGGAVDSVNGLTGAVVLTAADIGAASTTAMAGKADLVGGKLAISQLPAVAVGELFPVASQAAMLALTAQIGDVAVRSDLGNKRFLLLGTSTTLADWKSIDDAASSGVSTVNGQSGVVVLAPADVGAIPASQKGAASGVATLGADGLLLAAQRPPVPSSAGGTTTTPFLSTLAAQNSVAVRTPAATAAIVFGNRTYWQFTPSIDTYLTALRDALQTTNLAVKPFVFRVSDNVMLGTGPAFARASGTADFSFSAPILLAAGVSYLVGFDGPNPASTVINDRVNAASNGAGSYPNFTVSNVVRSGGAAGVYPTDAYVDVANGYTPPFSLLLSTDSHVKNVLGPLDPVDFPVVTDPALLTANSAALFDSGSGAIKILRKRADGSVVELAAGSSAAGAPASTFRQTAPLTVGTAFQGRVRCALTTTRARLDGSDIRVYRDALTLAHVIGSVTPVAGGYAYDLSWIDNIPAGSVSYRIEYGAQGSLPLASYAPSDLTALLRSFTLDRVGNNLASLDPSYAYVPADFATAGVQLFGARDDNAGASVLDGQQAVWNGTGYGTIYHSSNGTLQLSVSAGSGDRDGAPSFSDGLGWAANDLYESYRRQVLMPDGLAWHILTGTSGYSADIKLAIRYYRLSGIWTLTVVNWTNGSAQRTICAYAGGQRLAFQVPNINEANPEQAMTLVVLPQPAKAVASGEAAIP